MSKLSSAYIAGFFDGEGSINIIQQKARDRQQSTLIVSLANTKREILEMIQEIYGSNIVPVKVKGNAKPSYRYHLRLKKAEIFLRDIAPYLLLKRQQVLLGLKSRENVKPGNKNLSDEVLKERQYLESEIKRLNHEHIAELKWDIPDEAKPEYMAGFFDAEGSMSIVKPTPKFHRLFVSIASVDKGILEWFRSNSEDIGWITKREREYEKWSDSWRWQITDNNAVEYLKAIQPFLVIKSQQVEIAIKFRDTIREPQGIKLGSKRGSGDVKNPVTDELLRYRDELQVQIQALNKRGI